MKSKMAALFAVVMIALMVAGLAYAHWEKTITINGTVNTGKLHLSLEFFASTNDTKNYCTVGWTTGDNTLTVTVNKAYPCITVSGYLTIINDGTIPAGLHMMNLILPLGVTVTPGVFPGYNEVYENGVLIAKLWLYQMGAGTFEQIDPGQQIVIPFALHFEEGLREDATYTFTIEFVFYNWNEA
jgi:hypothetical protein